MSLLLGSRQNTSIPMLAVFFIFLSFAFFPSFCLFFFFLIENTQKKGNAINRSIEFNRLFELLNISGLCFYGAEEQM